MGVARLHDVQSVTSHLGQDGAASVVLMLVLQYVCDPVSSASQDRGLDT